jgi:hypothetical protein
MPIILINLMVNTQDLYTFYRKTSSCNVELLEFINNENGSFSHLKIEGDKVYDFSTIECEKSLLYDFGLEVNQVITEGLYEDWSVTAKYDVKCSKMERLGKDSICITQCMEILPG